MTARHVRSTGRLRAVGMLSAALIVMSGCSARMIDFTVISSKNVSLEGLRRGENRVVGKTCSPVVVFPLGQPDLKTAVDRAIESAGAPFNGLVDGVVTYQDKSFIFGVVCFEVTGTPIAIVANGGTRGRDDADPSLVLHSSLGTPDDYAKLRRMTIDATPR